MSENSSTRRTRRTRPKKDWAPGFLTELASRGVITAACEAACVPRRTVYDRRDSDPQFARQMAEALDEACDAMESEARRRAVEGVERPVYGSGGPGQGTVQVGTVREYSDTLLIFMLKAHRPAKYRDRYIVENRHDVHVNASLVIADPVAAELACRLFERIAVGEDQPGSAGMAGHGEILEALPAPEPAQPETGGRGSGPVPSADDFLPPEAR